MIASRSAASKAIPRAPVGSSSPTPRPRNPSKVKSSAVGPGARGEDGKVVPLELKPKDKVLFGKWSGTEVKIDGQELLIMKESDVMGVLTN